MAGETISGTAILRALVLTMLWPGAAAVSLAVAIGGSDVTVAGLLLLASGTMSAYGLDRVIDRRGQDPLALRRALRISVLLAALLTAGLACSSGWRFQVCAVLALIAGAYVPLKRFIPKNVLTVVAWTVAIATLPFAAQRPAGSEFTAAVLAVACLMAANTILCDLPDVAADRAAGVRGITPRFGPIVGAAVAIGFGLVGAWKAASVERWGLAITALCLALLALLLVRNLRRGIFRVLADAVVTFLPGPVSLLIG